jgi:hypothetical protein
MGLPLNGFEVVVPSGHGASLAGTLRCYAFHRRCWNWPQQPVVRSGHVRWRPGPAAAAAAALRLSRIAVSTVAYLL